jgi:hypothetical protein
MSFSERIVTLGSTEVANPLPVQFLSFSGRTIEGENHLFWETASEYNAMNYEVEHSTDGEQFKTIGSVEASGNSTQEQKYTFIDATPSAGWNYYRLKQIDLDGEYKYFKNLVALQIDPDKMPLNFSIYPNPSHGGSWLNIMKGNNLPVMIKIYDLSGKLVLSRQLELESLSSEIELNAPDLKSGVFIVEISQGAIRKIKRMIRN